VYGKLWELEFLCRIKALEKASKNNHNFNIFINVDPDIINDEKFKKGFTKEFLEKFEINPENIIFEITEKNSVADIQSFKKLIDHYKDQGYKIAIDDTGSGYSGLKLITDIHPHFIKLDMNLIRNVDKDGVKYSLIKTLYEFCLVTNIKVIAEGIETENEMNALIDIGIDYGQGYLIQRPSDEVIEISQEIIQHIKARNQKKRSFYIVSFDPG
jgi:EAL domain-containing protein (putative c-di-GMP-specific phosphodiesterase class I)